VAVALTPLAKSVPASVAAAAAQRPTSVTHASRSSCDAAMNCDIPPSASKIANMIGFPPAFLTVGGKDFTLQVERVMGFEMEYCCDPSESISPTITMSVKSQICAFTNAPPAASLTNTTLPARISDRKASLRTILAVLSPAQWICDSIESSCRTLSLVCNASCTD